MLQFSHSALFCLGFLRARCHRRVNYMYAFSPLYFSPSACLFSLAGYVRESRCTPLCVYVCVCERTCAGLVSLWTSLWCRCLFIYFPACEGPSSAVRAIADWACVALSAIHQRGAFLMDELVTLTPYSTSAVIFFRFYFQGDVEQPEGFCLVRYGWASYVKQYFSSSQKSLLLYTL